MTRTWYWVYRRKETRGQGDYWAYQAGQENTRAVVAHSLLFLYLDPGIGELMSQALIRGVPFFNKKPTGKGKINPHSLTLTVK